MANVMDIAKMTAMLSAAFPNWNLNEYTNEVYFEDLKDIPSDELLLAAQHCRSQAGRAFAPSTGEIRGAVMELRRKVTNVPSSYQAWQEVNEQIRINGGDFGKPAWSHPIVEQAVKAMGWLDLRMSENQDASRARFLQCYDQLQNRYEGEAMLLPGVRGYIESQGGLLSAPSNQIKKLSEGLSK